VIGYASGSPPTTNLRGRVRLTLMQHAAVRGYFLLSPTLAVMVLALAMPMGILIVHSFWIQEYFEIQKVFSWKNYVEFFERPLFSEVLIRSLKISCLSTIATVLLAYPMCYFIAFRVKRHKLIWIIMLTVPFWTSYLLRVFSWKVMLGFEGVINSGFMSLGLVDEPLSFLLYNQTAVIITLSHAWAAFAILPIYVSLEKIDRSLLDAAADLGDGPIMRFLRVTLPLSLPGVIAACLLLFIPTVGDYVTPALVGGNDGLMIGNVIKTMFGQANNWPLGAALSVITMLVVLAVVCLFLWLTSKARQPGTTGTHATEGGVTGGKFGVLGMYALAYLAFIYIPILMLLIFSFNDSIYISFPLKNFTLDWYQELLNNKALGAALWNSLQVGAIVAVVSTVLGTLAAKAVTRYRLKGGAVATGTIVLPLVIPHVILGISLLALIDMTGISLSLGTIGAGHLLICIPFSTLVMMSRLEGFDKNMEEASTDLGENAWTTFWRVTFPLALPGIIASLLLAFTISFDEFVISFFLAGEEVTLPIYIWSQLRFPNKLPSVLALGSLVVVASFALVGFAEWVRRRGAHVETASGV